MTRVNKRENGHQQQVVYEGKNQGGRKNSKLNADLDICDTNEVSKNNAGTNCDFPIPKPEDVEKLSCETSEDYLIPTKVD
jgi:hypothetical protein